MSNYTVYRVCLPRTVHLSHVEVTFICFTRVIFIVRVAASRVEIHAEFPVRGGNKLVEAHAFFGIILFRVVNEITTPRTYVYLGSYYA